MKAVKLPPMDFISTSDFESWLNTFLNCVKNPNNNIERMKMYADYFGNPHLDYKTLHVAGSKGKGSVTTMLSSVLAECGFNTGRYTSPHVMDFRERITKANSFFDNTQYSNAYRKIINGFNELSKEQLPAWFEIVTLLAFLLFKDEKLDWGVFEVGIGGRLDSTNILKPEACVIMPIELEHCKILGNNIADIAFEKAGIIKNNVPVFCFNQDDVALSVIKKIASEKKAPFFYLPEIVDDIQFSVSKQGISLKIQFNKKHSVGKLFSKPIETRLSFFDSVQVMNACITACVIKYLFPTIDESIIERGLEKAWLPGRFEIFKQDPLVILDGAHTENSIELCVKSYSTLVKQKNGILVFAAADDKNTALIAPLFSNMFSNIYLTIPGNFKASNLEKVAKDFKSKLKPSPNELTVSTDFADVLKTAYNKSKTENKPLLITGSFYLVGEAKKVFESL